MKNLDDISLVTYTNSKCVDVLDVYLKQLDVHLNSIKNYVFIDDTTLVKNPKHEFIKYDNYKPYYEQWLNCIANVKSEFVIYMQEDFILYDDVNTDALVKHANFLSTSTLSFIRLIRAGFDNSLQQIEKTYYNVPQTSPDIYQQQATLWKKEDLIKVYEKTASIKWLESDVWRQSVRDLKMSGVFVYNGEKKRGKYHYDSAEFPYICTAISRGLWNLNEYPIELGNILKTHNVNPTIRGVRKDYNYAR